MNQAQPIKFAKYRYIHIYQKLKTQKTPTEISEIPQWMFFDFFLVYHITKTIMVNNNLSHTKNPNKSL